MNNALKQIYGAKCTIHSKKYVGRNEQYIQTNLWSEMNNTLKQSCGAK